MLLERVWKVRGGNKDNKTESLYPYVMGYWEWDDWSVWDGLVGLAWIGQAGID